MPLPNTIDDLNTVASLNFPQGNNLLSVTDDALRAIQSILKQFYLEYKDAELTFDEIQQKLSLLFDIRTTTGTGAAYILSDTSITSAAQTKQVLVRFHANSLDNATLRIGNINMDYNIQVQTSNGDVNVGENDILANMICLVIQTSANTVLVQNINPSINFLDLTANTTMTQAAVVDKVVMNKLASGTHTLPATMLNGKSFNFVAQEACTLVAGTGGNLTELNVDGAVLSSFYLPPNQNATFIARDNKLICFTTIAQTTVTERMQTVFECPINAQGEANLGGATGSATVSTIGLVKASFGDGIYINGKTGLVGQILNPSWTGLNVNGKMYLYITRQSNGTCVTGASSIAPTYTYGNVYSTTLGQFTFSINENIAKVGDGTSATKVHRVYVGEVLVAGGVVTSITWYAPNGVAISPKVKPAVNTAYVFNNKIGANQEFYKANTIAICAIAEQNYPVGSIFQYEIGDNSATCATFSFISNVESRFIRNGVPVINNLTTGVRFGMTLANWDLQFMVDRGW